MDTAGNTIIHLKQTMSWKNGKQDGLHTGWHGNGQKRFEITYKDDEVNGLWTTWYENGQKKYERTYYISNALDWIQY